MADLASLIPERWRGVLAPHVASPEFAALSAFVDQERIAHEVYPPRAKTFAALAVPPDAVRVVIVGQDPYHGPEQANGLAFSVSPGLPHPPSLRNIFKERADDIGLAPPRSGDLSAWAREGVLLLNTSLSVRRGEANSHRKAGWGPLTDVIFAHLGRRANPPIFVLWGKPAQKKRVHLAPETPVLEAPHPSPLSAHRGFFGSRPFSQINARLNALGRPPVDWRVDEERP